MLASRIVVALLLLLLTLGFCQPDQFPTSVNWDEFPYLDAVISLALGTMIIVATAFWLGDSLPHWRLPLQFVAWFGLVVIVLACLLALNALATTGTWGAVFPLKLMGRCTVHAGLCIGLSLLLWLAVKPTIDRARTGVHRRFWRRRRSRLRRRMLPQ